MNSIVVTSRRSFRKILNDHFLRDPERFKIRGSATIKASQKVFLKTCSCRICRKKSRNNNKKHGKKDSCFKMNIYVSKEFRNSSQEITKKPRNNSDIL